MSATEGFFEKLRRSVLGADEQPIKEAQETVIHSEKELSKEQAHGAHAKEEVNSQPAKGSKLTRPLTPEEASLAFRYGTGILSFLNESPGSGNLAKSLPREEAFQAHGRESGLRKVEQSHESGGDRDRKINRHDEGESKVSSKIDRHLILAEIALARKWGMYVPDADEEESGFSWFLRTSTLAQLEMRR